MTKSNVIKGISAAVLTASLVFTATSFAMHHGDADKKNEQDVGGHRIEHMITVLELNEQQIDAFKAMHLDKDERKQDKMARKDLRQQLHELAMQDQLDEAKMNQLADKIASEARAVAVDRSRAFHNFYSSLSAEQKQKFNDMHAAMQQRGADRMEKREKKEKRDDRHKEHGMHH